MAHMTLFWRLTGRNPDELFLINYFVEFFVNFLTYNLLTIASFRIGVPSILFLVVLMGGAQRNPTTNSVPKTTEANKWL